MVAALTVALVMLAGTGAAGWVAATTERVAVAASGPCAGEPGLAGPAGRAVGAAAVGPVAVGAAAAALGGLLAWTVGPAAVLPAMLLLGGGGLVLAAVDVRTHRLPDAVVLPAYPVLALLLAVAALVGAAGDKPVLAPLSRAAAGGLAAFGAFYLLAVVVPAGFGFGDVKLTGLLGAGLAWLGWPVLLSGLILGFFYGGVGAAALLAAGRADRRDRLAFGPFLLAGALTAVVLRA